jgi:hypothetical protein
MSGTGINGSVTDGKRKKRKRKPHQTVHKPRYSTVWKKWFNELWQRRVLRSAGRVRSVIDSLGYKSGICTARPAEIARRANTSRANVLRVIAEDVAKGRYTQDDKGTLRRVITDRDEFERLRLQQDLDPLTALVRRLARMMSKTGEATRTRKQLAADLALSERTIQRVRPELKVMGFLYPEVSIGWHETTYTHDDLTPKAEYMVKPKPLKDTDKPKPRHIDEERERTRPEQYEETGNRGREDWLRPDEPPPPSRIDEAAAYVRPYYDRLEVPRFEIIDVYGRLPLPKPLSNYLYLCSNAAMRDQIPLLKELPRHDVDAAIAEFIEAWGDGDLGGGPLREIAAGWRRRIAP